MFSSSQGMMWEFEDVAINHLYADDTQLYISFTPTNSALSLEALTNTFTDILS